MEPSGYERDPALSLLKVSSLKYESSCAMIKTDQPQFIAGPLDADNSNGNGMSKNDATTATTATQVVDEREKAQYPLLPLSICESSFVGGGGGGPSCPNACSRCNSFQVDARAANSRTSSKSPRSGRLSFFSSSSCLVLLLVGLMLGNVDYSALPLRGDVGNHSASEKPWLKACPMDHTTGVSTTPARSISSTLEGGATIESFHSSSLLGISVCGVLQRTGVIVGAEAALMPLGIKRSYRKNPKRSALPSPHLLSASTGPQEQQLIDSDRAVSDAAAYDVRGDRSGRIKVNTVNRPGSPPQKSSFLVHRADETGHFSSSIPVATSSSATSSETSNRSSNLQANGQKWIKWIALPAPRIGGFAIQTDHFLFVIGGASESVMVSALRERNNINSAITMSSGPAEPELQPTERELVKVKVNAFTGELVGGRGAGAVRASSSSANTPEIDIILFINLLVSFRYNAIALTGDAVPPIASKSGFALVGYDIFLSYACDVSSNETASGLFIKVSLPPGELWSLEEVPQPTVSVRVQNPSSQRYAASLGQYEYFVRSPDFNPDEEDNDYDVIRALPTLVSYLYLFGGRDNNMKPIETVEQFFNGTWSTLSIKFPKPYCLCSVTQGHYGGGQGGEGREDALYITDCHDCTSWETVGDAVIFLPRLQRFVFAANSTNPSDIPESLWWPARQGIASRDLMGSHIVGLTYSPSPLFPDDPLALMLYDTVRMHQVAPELLHPTGIEDSTTNCAVFSMAGYLMCLGGQFVADGRASMWAYTVQMLPNIYAMLNRSNGIYYVGETPNAVTSGHCRPNTMFMVATDPDCRVRIPYTKPFKCNNPETKIPVSHLTVREDEEIEMYICATDGSCEVDVNNRKACLTSSNVIPNGEYSCLAARCCWDEKGINPSTNLPMRCFLHGPLPDEDENDDGTDSSGRRGVSWMQTTMIHDTPSFNPRPLVLMRAPVTPDRKSDPPKFPQWLMIVMAIVGTALLSLLAVLLVRYDRQRKQMLKRKAYSTNAFFAAFGKAYQVQGLIGQGSYGAVFLAERARDNRLVALKIIPCWDFKQRDMALREFDLLNNLNHPNLIPVLDLIINWDSKTQPELDGGAFDTISKKSRLQLESGGRHHSGSELDSQFSGTTAAASGVGSGKSSNDTMHIAGDSGGGSGGNRGGIASPTRCRSGMDNETNSKSNATNVPVGAGARAPSTLDPSSPTAHLSAGPVQSQLATSNTNLLTSSSSNNTASPSRSPSCLEREALLKGSDLSDMIPNSSRLPSRFICIATEFFPEGDLTRFVVSYPRRGAIIIADHDPLECVMHYEQVGESLAMTQQQRDKEREREQLRKSGGGGYGSTAAAINNGGGGNGGASTRSFAGGSSSFMNVQSNMIAFAELSGGDPATTRPIPELTIVGFCTQIAEVLAYMHNLTPPLVHRDLKPDNVLVDKDRVVVTDFGLSSWQTNAETGIAADTCVGTLFFTAPEALGGMGSGSAITPSVDCWALGCILYAMCTRRVLPETARVMFSDVDDDDFESDIRGDLAIGGYTTATANIVLRLLQREPQDRMTSLQALEAFRAVTAMLKERASLH